MGRFFKQYWIPPAAPGAIDRGEATPIQYEAFVADEIADLDLAVSPRTGEVVAQARDAILRFQDSAARVGSVDAMVRAVRRAEVAARDESTSARHWRARVARELEEEARLATSTRAAIDTLLEAERSGEDDWAAAMSRTHRILLHGLESDAYAEAGRVRSVPMWLGSRRELERATNPAEGAFVAAPPKFVGPLYEDLARYMARRDVDPIVQSAIVHGQFQVVHPFLDGNGRLGRLLHHPILARLGEHVVAPPVGVALARNFDAYIVGLRSAWYEDDLDSWVALFARFLERSADMAIDLASRFAEAEQAWIDAIVSRDAPPAHRRRLLRRR